MHPRYMDTMNIEGSLKVYEIPLSVIKGQRSWSKQTSVLTSVWHNCYGTALFRLSLFDSIIIRQLITSEKLAADTSFCINLAGCSGVNNAI